MNVSSSAPRLILKEGMTRRRTPADNDSVISTDRQKLTNSFLKQLKLLVTDDALYALISNLYQKTAFDLVAEVTAKFTKIIKEKNDKIHSLHEMINVTTNKLVIFGSEEKRSLSKQVKGMESSLESAELRVKMLENEVEDLKYKLRQNKPVILRPISDSMKENKNVLDKTLEPRRGSNRTDFTSSTTNTINLGKVTIPIKESYNEITPIKQENVAKVHQRKERGKLNSSIKEHRRFSNNVGEKNLAGFQEQKNFKRVKFVEIAENKPSTIGEVASWTTDTKLKQQSKFLDRD